jgi:trigger factor
MSVIREELNKNSALLRIKVAKNDYEKKVENAIEKARKQAKIPGFRPGHVPTSLIRKQYGKSILAEELNKTVNDFLQNFIKENNLQILGNPIPYTNEEVKGDFNNPDTFEFTFEIGLAPSIELGETLKKEFEYIKVGVDTDLVNKQIDDLRRRYGKLVASEEVNEKDLVLAVFTELNEEGTPKENGIVNSSTISMEFVEDENTKKILLGKKVGDAVNIDPTKVTKGSKDTAALLNIKEEELDAISSNFEMKINEIRQMELAELNQELFDKLFGEGEVTSEEILRDRVTGDLDKMFANDSDRLLTRKVYEELMETPVDLPSDFLKRWIQVSNEKPISMEEIEAQFEGYEKGMKWQLIQGHIFKANNIQLNQAEVIEYAKNLISNQYAQYGIPAPADEELTKSAIQVLGNKEESARIMDMIAESKLTEYFKSTVKLNDKIVSYDEFIEIASK